MNASPLELDVAGLRAYVFGSLHLRGAAHTDLNLRVTRALRWYQHLVVRCGGQGVLFSWVYDTGFLLVEGDTFAFRSLVDLDQWAEAERDPRLEYENRLLNGLLRDASVRRAIEAIRQDPDRDDLVQRTIELLLAPLIRAGGHAGAPALDPVLLRELAASNLEVEDEAAAYVELAGEGTLLAAMTSSLERFFAQRVAGPALGPDDLSEIEHWSAYRRAAQRLAGRRIGARAAAFPKIRPGEVVVREEEQADTELPDSGYYPSGGYSELATRGALENLVPTELIYMGEDPYGDEERPEVDLFTIRLLENETLYFQRDSGQLRRTRRVVHVAVAPDDGLRFQLKWHSDPLVVMVYGLALRLVEDLATVFPSDALTVALHLIYQSEEARRRAEEDADLLSVLLRHEIAQGTAAVLVDGPDFDLRRQGEMGRRVYGVAVQSGDRRPAGLGGGESPRLADGVRPPRLIVFKVGGEPPGEKEAEGVVYFPVDGPPEGPLVAARDRLLSEIAGVGSRRRPPQGARPR